jgi:hypothetical protein
MSRDLLAAYEICEADEQQAFRAARLFRQRLDEGRDYLEARKDAEALEGRK